MLEKLCAGGTTTAKIRREIAYCDLHSSDDAIFSMMVATGYLNAVFNGEDYTISIPNREIHEVFRQAILQKFGGSGRDVLESIRAMAERNRGRSQLRGSPASGIRFHLWLPNRVGRSELEPAHDIAVLQAMDEPVSDVPAA